MSTHFLTGIPSITQFFRDKLSRTVFRYAVCHKNFPIPVYRKYRKSYFERGFSVRRHTRLFGKPYFKVHSVHRLPHEFPNTGKPKYYRYRRYRRYAKNTVSPIYRYIYVYLYAHTIYKYSWLILEYTWISFKRNDSDAFVCVRSIIGRPITWHRLANHMTSAVRFSFSVYNLSAHQRRGAEPNKSTLELLQLNSTNH